MYNGTGDAKMTYYPCRSCGGTMVGQFCSDCGFDEMQFINEWEQFSDETETELDDREAA
jgi:hypothetical protein